jgi:hypothetical protein
MTKTDSSTFTPEEIEYAGYRYVGYPPHFDITRQRVTWSIGENGVADWEVVDIPIEEKWQEVRLMRDERMAKFEWRILRYNRETLLSLPYTDSNITGMHQYMQDLADITTQPDPFAIQWPQYISNTAMQPVNDV